MLFKHLYGNRDIRFPHGELCQVGLSGGAQRHCAGNRVVVAACTRALKREKALKSSAAQILSADDRARVHVAEDVVLQLSQDYSRLKVLKNVARGYSAERGSALKQHHLRPKGLCAALKNVENAVSRRPEWSRMHCWH